MKTERHYAQRHYKVSKLLAQGEEQWIESRMSKWGKPASRELKARKGAKLKVQNMEQFNAKARRRGENNQSADYGGYSRNNPLTTGFISVTC